ncbi:MAG: hypothetical protein IKU40_05910 [Clostridia bacterium]|nr:hypothetical protein [Clostridia bacterium]
MGFNLKNTVDFADVLLGHAKRYPRMTPQDAVKLIYQATFGVGHMLAEESIVRARIDEEMRTMLPADVPVTENIGGGFMRFHMNGTSIERMTDLADLVAALFLEAGTHSTGTDEQFSARLDILRKLTADGAFSFGTDELEAYLADYLADGLRAVSHSETYRAAYHPAYRVVSRDLTILLPLLDDIRDRSDSVILVIDGFCASGKSTLASRLAKIFGARLIHMDDFFLPPSKRTPERFAEPGGNVDYERFYDEVVCHLADDVLTYGVFDCSEMAVTHNAVLPKTPVTIIEGAYALHPHFGNYADIRAFMETDEAEQKRRIRERDGEEMLEMFESRWIPFERKYEAAYGVRESCAYRIRT